MKILEYKYLKDIDFAGNIKGKVFGIFLARDVSVRKQKDGITDFITLNMCDKGTIIEARKFGASPQEVEMMKNGGVYKATINVEEYSKSPTGYSCILYNFEPFDEEPSKFIEWTDKMDEALQSVQSALDRLKGSVYYNLVANLLVSNWDKFSKWTAASSFHHYALGGLLVHTAEVLRQSELLADYWNMRYSSNFINKELLMSAALIHDIAKVHELKVDELSGNTEYATIASLETHITLGLQMIDNVAMQVGMGVQTEGKTAEQLAFEKEALSLIRHCLISHHGKKEFGSPIDPNCPEAYILTMADQISAEMFRYNKNFETMEAGTSQTVWLGGKMVSTYKDSTKSKIINPE